MKAAVPSKGCVYCEFASATNDLTPSPLPSCYSYQTLSTKTLALGQRLIILSSIHAPLLRGPELAVSGLIPASAALVTTVTLLATPHIATLGPQQISSVP